MKKKKDNKKCEHKVCGYKEHPHDFSKLSLEEIDALIEKAREEGKKFKSPEDSPEVKEWGI